MNIIDYNYHLDNLRELDPDQLVSDLNLSTEDIIMHFPCEVRDFIEENFG